jgi:3-deoxy-D-manno-octulosonic-acid transferase
VFPLLLLYAALRIGRNRAYAKHLGERFGWLPPRIPKTKPGGVWLHAVSVGEIVSAVPLLEELRRRLPGTPLFVSTTTLAGRALAEQRLTRLCDGVFYAPLDLPFAIRAVLRRIRPTLFLNLETEIWPNTLREVKRSGAMVAQVNARISDKAWPQYQRFQWFFSAVLTQIDFLAPQSPQDAERFLALGYQGPTEELGNLKFDFRPNGAAPPADVAEWLARQEALPLWIAASTMPPAFEGDVDEDDAVIAAQQRLNCRLILVPRKPERFDSAAAKLAAAGIPFARRTQLAATPQANVLLLDSIGELASLFPLADAVFMGGTLNQRGGHNILEPAFFGRPIVTGPHMENFAAIAQLFRQASAIDTIDRPEQLAPAIAKAFHSPSGRRAQELAQSLSGVSQRLADRLLPLLDQAVPCGHYPLHSLARLFTFPWRWASQLHKPARRLPVPVISIGNLSMGGTGKTPFVLALGHALHQQGKRVAILTRGYGQDESKLFAAAGIFQLGIGADRFATGQKLLAEAPFDVALLDDGFQHRRLHRDLDIVLIDALNLFPGFGVPPAGLLREPFEALARADAFVITRVSPNRQYEGLQRFLRAYNAKAPIYLAPQIASLPPLPEAKTLHAFCGLGNPASFRQTLDSLGLAHVELTIFPDHHPYSEADLKSLRQRADVLLTTSKDLVRIANPAGILVIPMQVVVPNPLLAKASFLL